MSYVELRSTVYCAYCVLDTRESMIYPYYVARMRFCHVKEMSDIVREILDTYRVIAELPCATWLPYRAKSL